MRYLLVSVEVTVSTSPVRVTILVAVDVSCRFKNNAVKPMQSFTDYSRLQHY